ncbi:predicted protein [Nematostella vectensis]|uniref:Uncharacterized protein n=1 Tax=Nematostella vectensis TaxID=45351 RepID=A7SRM6_NEMVE|nr:predicted protein [Nematostella vectensis]|eukprot:XP_001625758.1 predicted protein [Nematostella vectensis]
MSYANAPHTINKPPIEFKTLPLLLGENSEELSSGRHTFIINSNFSGSEFDQILHHNQKNNTIFFGKQAVHEKRVHFVKPCFAFQDFSSRDVFKRSHAKANKGLLFSGNLNKSKNLDIPFEKYNRFDLESLTDDECLSEFRFIKNDLYRLNEALNFPDQITCPNHLTVDGMEALCMTLRRFAYPCRYEDLVPRFARAVPQISMVVHEAVSYIYTNYRRLYRSRTERPFSLQPFDENCGMTLSASATPSHTFPRSVDPNL